MKKIKKLLVSEVDGIGVVEVILILVVLVGLVVIFRTQINGIVSTLFNKINNMISSF
ncbi:MAG: hypothetical protein GX237_04570 [Clostridiales bacterium]|nr:hypothetical protein [Clostridiales bacterium]